MLYNNGLILEGGGMRGVFTTGALDFLLEKEIEFANIIGVSAGACHGASFVSKQHGRAKDVVLDYINDKRYCSVYSLITTGDMFGVKFAYYEIPNKLNLFDNETYNKRETKLYAVVTNVDTGKAEYIELKDFSVDIEGLRASASLPLISRIVKFKGKKYLDGGISDSVPIKRAEEMGIKKNIVVLTQPKGYVKGAMSTPLLMKFRYIKYPNFVKSALIRHEMYNSTMDYIEQGEKEGRIFVIRPKEDLKVGRLEKDVDKLAKIYEKGYLCAKEEYEKLLEFLES